LISSIYTQITLAIEGIYTRTRVKH